MILGFRDWAPILATGFQKSSLDHKGDDGLYAKAGLVFYPLFMYPLHDMFTGRCHKHGGVNNR